MSLSAGKKLGRYEIRSQLGAGGMGEVYLAHDTQLRRPVALKLLPAKYTADRERLQRFEQEACAASALNHPNILTVYEIGVENDTHFIATEYVDAVTLRQKLREAKMRLGDALDVSHQTAFALTAAYAAGVVHRDIKPEHHAPARPRREGAGLRPRRARREGEARKASTRKRRRAPSSKPI